MFFKAICRGSSTRGHTNFLLAALVAGAAVLAPTSTLAQDPVPVGVDYSAKVFGRIAPRFVVSSARPLWPNARISYYYNPQSQPDGLSTAEMEGLLQVAARKWENVCNVRFSYLGTTTARPDLGATFETTDRVNVIGWELLTGSQAQFSGFVSWWYQNQGNAMIDADMVLNTAMGGALARNKPGLGGLLTHEMGHMLAINHSNVQQSVMFATPYNDLSFQSSLRADDAAACASLYGPSPLAHANRIFNWAEQTFTQFLSPVGAASQDLEGYHYRFYPGSNSYIAERAGVLYYLPVGGSVIPLGSVTDLMPSATGAGF